MRGSIREAYFINTPLSIGRKTADGALMLLFPAMCGLTPQVSHYALIR